MEWYWVIGLLCVSLGALGATLIIWAMLATGLKDR